MANARTRVVQFARRQNAQVNKITYTDVRDYPLYNFELTVPLPSDVPEIVSYWRERVDSTQGDSTQPGDDPTTTSLRRPLDRPNASTDPAGKGRHSPRVAFAGIRSRPGQLRPGDATRMVGSLRKSTPVYRNDEDPLRESTGPTHRFSGRDETEPPWEHWVVLRVGSERSSNGPESA